MLTVAEAMSASMHWNFLAQYSILKEMFADLRSIATTWCKLTGSPTEPMEEEMEQEENKGAEKEEVEHGQSGGSANVPLEKEMEKKEEVKEQEEKPSWIRKLEEFVAGLWWQEEEANTGSTVETEVATLQRSMGAEAPDHQEVEVQSGGVEEQLEQFEKKLEQLEDQLEEHAQDAAAHGEVEKVKETGGGGQATAAVEEQLEQFEEQLEQLEEQLEEHAQDAAAHEGKVEETGGGGQAPAAVHEGQVGNQCYHLTSHFDLHQEEVEGELVDPQVVERLHHAYRLLQFPPGYVCQPDNIATQAWRARSCSYGSLVARGGLRQWLPL